jgi:hypothetical protein
VGHTCPSFSIKQKKLPFKFLLDSHIGEHTQNQPRRPLYHSWFNIIFHYSYMSVQHKNESNHDNLGYSTSTLVSQVTVLQTTWCAECRPVLKQGYKCWAGSNEQGHMITNKPRAKTVACDSRPFVFSNQLSECL